MRALAPVVTILALLPGPGPAYAQDVAQTAADASQAAPARPQPRTGDAWIDARLLDMDDYAARHGDAFVDEIVRYHEAPRALVEGALAGGAMRPGDVYFACALAQATGRSCRTVLDARREDPAAGWDAIAAQLDVAPAVYRRIRGDITESYVRWARPLDSGASSPP
ncbi:hypothetical protein [Luteimonas saliphila]|uniref:hypothetical protein n=1 Tax=Luteimonas saliphila TaxID=2804919 RepID=UPI00192DD5A5|nr:hypothetical protein [Luteimonas saliphila]